MRFTPETERLILRDLTPEDYQAAFLWCGDPDVARYMVYPVYTKAEDVRTWLESRDLDDPDEFDAGIVLRSTGELIGSGGLYYKAEDDLWTIGYNLRKDQWGNGYAVEVIRGILEDPEMRNRVGHTARETIPVPWSRVLETAAERYERLVALGREGKLKDKRRRLV